MVGELGQENHAAYVATKGAVIALTKAMALDYAPFGIRVNAICPAAVWTPLLREWVQEQPNPAGAEDFLNHIHALGYCPDGDVVADVAVFLLSDQARFMTGVALPVSGGAELGYRRSAACKRKGAATCHSVVITRVSTQDARFQLKPGEGVDAIHTNPAIRLCRRAACTPMGR